jgi:putative pyruvate formate lyase activating enzyme
MPGGMAESETIFKFLVEEISSNTYLNIMSQYHPCYKAGRFPDLNRELCQDNFRSMVELALSMGLRRLDQRRQQWFLL